MHDQNVTRLLIVFMGNYMQALFMSLEYFIFNLEPYKLYLNFSLITLQIFSCV